MGKTERSKWAGAHESKLGSKRVSIARVDGNAARECKSARPGAEHRAVRVIMGKPARARERERKSQLRESCFEMFICGFADVTL